MKTYDAVIAGGGLIGGAIAFELARAGLRVAVLDRQEPGREASWAGAGILSPAPEHAGMVPLLPLGKASLARYPQFVADVEEISGQRAGFRPKGTLEALLTALQKIEYPVVAIKVVGQGVGAVSDSDLLLASVSSAIIVCFNLKPTPSNTAAAERAKVEVRYYDVIYKLTEDVERAAKGLREPTYRQIREGRVEVITPIKIPRRSSGPSFQSWCRSSFRPTSSS